MEKKLLGDLLLGLEFAKLEIFSTPFIDFHYDKLEELKSKSYLFKRVLNKLLMLTKFEVTLSIFYLRRKAISFWGLLFVKLEILSTPFIDFLYVRLKELRSRCFPTTYIVPH